MFNQTFTTICNNKAKISCKELDKSIELLKSLDFEKPEQCEQVITTVLQLLNTIKMDSIEFDKMNDKFGKINAVMNDIFSDF